MPIERTGRWKVELSCKTGGGMTGQAVLTVSITLGMQSEGLPPRWMELTKDSRKWGVSPARR